MSMTSQCQKLINITIYKYNNDNETSALNHDIFEIYK